MDSVKFIKKALFSHYKPYYRKNYFFTNALKNKKSVGILEKLIIIVVAVGE
jgi:hypothetical protein